MRIPTMILRADVPALIQLNGAALGEADRARFLSLPVAPDGVYYVTLLPLRALSQNPDEEKLFPVTRKIELRRGRLHADALSEDVSVSVWPGGVFDVLLRAGRFPETRTALSGMVEREKLRDGRVATLFREGGLHIVIEKREEQLFAHSLNVDGYATMEKVTVSTDELLYVLVKHAQGTKCCVIACGTPRVVYEGEGDSFAFSEGGIVRIAALGTLLRHQQREAYSATTGELLHSSVGWFSYSANKPQSELDAVKCLLDAVKYDLEELPNYLGGSLASLKRDQLHEFFGEFEAYADPPVELSDHLLLGLLSPGDKPQITVARLFSFEVEGDAENGFKIVNAAES